MAEVTFCDARKRLLEIARNVSGSQFYAPRQQALVLDMVIGADAPLLGGPNPLPDQFPCKPHSLLCGLMGRQRQGAPNVVFQRKVQDVLFRGSDSSYRSRGEIPANDAFVNPRDLHRVR